MKINIDEIQKITSLLLLKLKQSKGNEIEIHNDFFWDIIQDELYNPYEKPKEILLGQLSFDLDNIQRLLETDNAIPYDLQRLSNIIKALSIENKTAF